MRSSGVLGPPNWITLNPQIDPKASSGQKRLGVKDLIDVKAMPTTAGSVAVAQRARPALSSAPCVERLEAHGYAVIGKTNTHELAIGGTGINPHYGTPVNPIDWRLIPGGSSSGSAAAVGAGECDVALGTDTAGSLRHPAACCAVSSIKPSSNRVPKQGVLSVAPSLDSIGLLARDLQHLTSASAVLLDDFKRESLVAADQVGFFKLPDFHAYSGVDPRIENAAIGALRVAELSNVVVDVPGWVRAFEVGLDIFFREAFASWGQLLDDSDAHLGADVRHRLEIGRDVSQERYGAALSFAKEFETGFRQILRNCGGVLATVGRPGFAEPVSALVGRASPASVATLPVNVADFAAVVIPVPCIDAPPASLQLIGEQGSEETLLATAALIESGVNSITGPWRP